MNWSTCIILLGILFFQAQLTAGSDQKVLPVRELPDFTVPRGQVLYQRYCLFCHGENGAGDGQNAFSLPKRPADLSQVVSRGNQEQLAAALRGTEVENSRNSSMPSFGGTLSALEISHLVAYISNFKKEEVLPAGDMDL